MLIWARRCSRMLWILHLRRWQNITLRRLVVVLLIRVGMAVRHCTSLSKYIEGGCEQWSVWLEWGFGWGLVIVCFGWFIPIGTPSRLSRNPPPCFRFLDPHPRTLYRMLRLTSRRNSIRSTTQHGKEINSYSYLALRIPTIFWLVTVLLSLLFIQGM